MGGGLPATMAILAMAISGDNAMGALDYFCNNQNDRRGGWLRRRETAESS
jgi:hypothetical protein